jgi:hypothetical protein
VYDAIEQPSGKLAGGFQSAESSFPEGQAVPNNPFNPIFKIR